MTNIIIVIIITTIRRCHEALSSCITHSHQKQVLSLFSMYHHTLSPFVRYFNVVIMDTTVVKELL